MLGKDRGKVGTVDRVWQKTEEVLLGGLNLYKKHHKPKSDDKKSGGIVAISRPIAVAKVALLCSKCGKVTRIGYKIIAGEKVRFCKKCQNKI